MILRVIERVVHVKRLKLDWGVNCKNTWPLSEQERNLKIGKRIGLRQILLLGKGSSWWNNGIWDETLTCTDEERILSFGVWLKLE